MIKRKVIAVMTASAMLFLVACGGGPTGTETGIDQTTSTVTDETTESTTVTTDTQATESQTDDPTFTEPDDTADSGVTDEPDPTDTETSEPTDPDISVEPTETDDLEPITVDIGSTVVSIFYPAGYFVDFTEEDYEFFEESSEFDTFTRHDDGSVTGTISVESYNEIISEMRQSILESMEEMIDAEVGLSYVIDIRYDDDFSEVIVEVDAAEYEEVLINDVTFTLGIMVPTYRMFINEDPAATITFVDADNGQTIEVFDLS